MLDQRRFERIKFDASAHFEFNDQFIQGKLQDISLKGALVRLPNSYDGILDGNLGDLIITLNDETTRLTFGATVVYQHGLNIGFECFNMDFKTAEHITKLLSVNLGSEDLLERELEKLIETANIH
ncbi:MAG: PilZ domain-containing protein [Saccharospirillaceae bacterium]|nr:PilZ domain-containing protein [Pseudomonadales bacterium]NRB79581.1 PilZ domain-containing protein [Saccharospirillaceae bacterium]